MLKTARAQAEAQPIPVMSPIHRAILLLLFFCKWAIIVIPRFIGIDFFPIWYGAGRVLQGHLPYGVAESQIYSTQWWLPVSDFSQAGIAYPLTAMLPLVPLQWLEFKYVLGVAMGLSFVLAWRALAAYDTYGPFLLFTFAWSQGFDLGQMSLWGMIFFLFWYVGYRDQRPHLMGSMCFLMIMFKPQFVLVPALMMLLRRRVFWREYLVWATITGGVWLITELIWHWTLPWLAQVRYYSSWVPLFSDWWLVFIMLLIPVRLIWLTWPALCSPIVQHYGFMPLTLLWVRMPWIMIVAAGFVTIQLWRSPIAVSLGYVALTLLSIIWPQRWTERFNAWDAAVQKALVQRWRQSFKRQALE